MFALAMAYASTWQAIMTTAHIGDQVNVAGAVAASNDVTMKTVER